jgi:rubrerythrin
VALTAELNAQKFYSELVKITTEGELKKFYSELSNFEDEHIKFLEKKIQESPAQEKGGPA